MTILNNPDCHHVHCVGVGGIGVSALAELLVERGYRVSGSDVVFSDRLAHLATVGVNTYIGHDAAHVTGADAIVFSSAVSADNPELLYAQAQGLPIVHRGQLLAEFMQGAAGIAVAGTHGKTTTTAMLSHVLQIAGLEPTFFIGGILQNQQSPVSVGAGEYFLAEADESDASFLHLHPKIAVVTNLEADHLESYAGSETALVHSFQKFLSRIPTTGFAVLCGDDARLQACMPGLACDVVTYGSDAGNDYVLSSVTQRGLQTDIMVLHQGKTTALTLQVAGLHNALNALAAWCVAARLGVPVPTIVAALETFQGVGRRLEYHGVMSPLGVDVFEDYGHHPTELRVTIETLRAAYPGRRLVMVFQPHRYSRTRDLFSEFVAVLKAVDVLLLLPTYAASEPVIQTATSEALFQALQHPQAQWVADPLQLPGIVQELLQPQDVLIFQGAGDVTASVKHCWVSDD